MVEKTPSSVLVTSSKNAPSSMARSRGAPGSFLFLVAMPGAPSSILAPSSDAPAALVL